MVTSKTVDKVSQTVSHTTISSPLPNRNKRIISIEEAHSLEKVEEYVRSMLQVASFSFLPFHLYIYVSKQKKEKKKKEQFL